MRPWKITMLRLQGAGREWNGVALVHSITPRKWRAKGKHSNPNPVAWQERHPVLNPQTVSSKQPPRWRATEEEGSEVETLRACVSAKTTSRDRQLIPRLPAKEVTHAPTWPNNTTSDELRGSVYTTTIPGITIITINPLFVSSWSFTALSLFLLLVIHFPSPYVV